MIVIRDNILRLVDGDPKAWAKRWGLMPFTTSCVCGRETTTSVPFACGPVRGLIAPDCECGHDYPPYCVVGANGDEDLFAEVPT